MTTEEERRPSLLSQMPGSGTKSDRRAGSSPGARLTLPAQQPPDTLMSSLRGRPSTRPHVVASMDGYHERM